MVKKVLKKKTYPKGDSFCEVDENGNFSNARLHEDLLSSVGPEEGLRIVLALLGEDAKKYPALFDLTKLKS